VIKAQSFHRHIARHQTYAQKKQGPRIPFIEANEGKKQMPETQTGIDPQTPDTQSHGPVLN